MFIQLPSHEEKLLSMIIEKCDRDSKIFSFSSQLLPPELWLYRQAMQSLVSKGYVYKEMPMLRTVAGFATDKATINATQYNAIDAQTLKSLVDAVKKEIISLPTSEDAEIANDSVEVLETELAQPVPKKV